MARKSRTRPSCKAIKRLYDHTTEVHEIGDNSLWSLGLHCSVKYYLHRRSSFEKALYGLERFHKHNVNPQSEVNDWNKARAWVKKIWNESSGQMPCLDLRDLFDENGDRFCKCDCIQPEKRMYRLSRKDEKDLKSVELATREKQLSDFVKLDRNGPGKYLVNAEPGVGKTIAVLKELAKTDQKVLYLAPRHNLLDEIAEKFLLYGGKSEDMHIYEGIETSNCAHKKRVSSLMKRGVPYTQFCHSKCKYLTQGSHGHKIWEDCIYRDQKTHAALKRILLMATPTLINQKLFDNEELDNKNRSIVVIDEDHLQEMSKEVKLSKEDLSTNIKFLTGRDSNSLLPLRELALKLYNFLTDTQRPAFSLTLRPNKKDSLRFNVDNIGKDIYRHANKYRRFKGLLYDLDYLHTKGGTIYRRLDENRKPYLRFYKRVEYPEDRSYYFLDGAADISLYKKLFPGIKTLKKNKDILEMSSEVKIIQYIEESFSLSSLTSGNKMDELLGIVRAILTAKSYEGQRIGIITKKAVKESIEKLVKSSFSDKDPPPVVKHFGDITGVDDFKDYEVGIIVGMQTLYFTDYAREAERLVRNYSTGRCYYDWVKIQSTEKYTYEVLNPRFEDPFVQSMFKHFCLGATVQAIGRWRPYRKEEREFCDIFLLNNYATGLPVHPMDKDELFEFLKTPLEDRPEPKDRDLIEKLAWQIMKEKGCVKNEYIRDVLNYCQDKTSKVSKVLSPLAKRMEWRRDNHNVYHEQ